MKYAWIAQQLGCHALALMCRVLKVSRSGFYAWRRQSPGKRELANQALVPVIKAAHEEFRQAYGTERLLVELRERGHACGRHRLARLRREHGIVTLRRRKFLRLQVHHRVPPAPRLLEWPMASAKPDQVWAADVTQIRAGQKWLYLAIVLDLCTRRVVGWSMAERTFQELTLNALGMALAHRPKATGRIHHSDQGTTYTSPIFRQELATHGITQSMSRAGMPYDNAMVESFFSSLKNELTHHMRFDSVEQAKRHLFDYIEVFYNRKRRHQALGYRSPVQFEAELQAVA